MSISDAEAVVRRIECYANTPYREGSGPLTREQYESVTDALRILLKREPPSPRSGAGVPELVARLLERLKIAAIRLQNNAVSDKGHRGGENLEDLVLELEAALRSPEPTPEASYSPVLPPTEKEKS